VHSVALGLDGLSYTPESMSLSPKTVVLSLTSKKRNSRASVVVFLYDMVKKKSGAVGEGIVGADFRDFRL